MITISNAREKKSEAYINSVKEKQKMRRDEFKRLHKDQQETIKLKLKLTQNEFPYIEDAIKDEILLEHLRKQMKKQKVVLGDPGKRKILTLRCGDKMYTYSSGRRIIELKRKKYTRLRQNYYNKNIKPKIIKEEIDICKTSVKTVELDRFENYLRIKFNMLRKIGDVEVDKYNMYINKLKWHSYINKQRHESKILKEINNVFGKDAIMIIGDWSQMDVMRGLSSPNLGIKRLLQKEHEVYLLDEYDTSIKHHETKEKMKNLRLDVRNKNSIIKSKEMHAIFTYKMSNGNIGCINRDYNAVMNMENIVVSLLRTGKRPIEFCR